MKLTAACVTAGIISAASAKGTVQLSVSKRDRLGQASDVAQGVYKRQTTGSGVYKRQTSSAGTIEESIYDVLPWSLGGAYYTNVTVGTPPQVQTVILDTGSSDLYFDSSSAPDCKNENLFNSCRGGSFDSSASSTYKVVTQGGFNTSFGDGSTATGDFASDTIGIGDAVLQNVQFGLASEVDSTTGFAVGLMGLGYSLNEASQNTYPNMPEVLQSAGAINSRLYSVFLNELGDATGTILFGGVDTSKYTGELVTLDLLPVAVSDGNGGEVGYVYEFVVAVTGVSSSASGTNKTYLSNGDPTGVDTDKSLPVLLDTGSSAWTVKPELYSEIAAVFGNDLDEYGNIACSHQNDDISLTVEFGGKKSITVQARDLIVPVYDASTNQQNTTSSGEPLCTFMVVSDYQNQEFDESGFLTLGDAVLRSMYVVFDLDNGQVSIAQAIANASTAASQSGSGDNIKVVKAGANGVASAVGSANGGVETASTNTYTIDPEKSATQSLDLSTASSAVGTATGTNALPEAGRVTAGSSSGSSSSSSGTGSGSSSGSTSTSSSHGAASGVRVPAMQWGGVVVAGVWASMIVLGAALLL